MLIHNGHGHAPGLQKSRKNDTEPLDIPNAEDHTCPCRQGRKAGGGLIFRGEGLLERAPGCSRIDTSDSYFLKCKIDIYSCIFRKLILTVIAQDTQRAVEREADTSSPLPLTVWDASHRIGWDGLIGIQF